MRWLQVSLVCFLVALVSCFTSDAASAAREFPIGVGATGQNLPLVAYNSTRNEYFVLWSDGERKVLEGRRATPNDSGGVSLGPVRGLGGNSRPESLAYNPRRREYLLLSKDIPFNSRTPLMATRIRPNGKVRGGRVQISTARGCGGVEGADLVYVPTRKRWLAVWGEERCGIKGRFLSGKGLGFDEPELVLAEAGFLFFPHLSLAYSSTADEILLVYYDSEAQEIRALRLDNRGVVLSLSTVAPEADVISSPVVVHLPTRNRWFVTWISNAKVEGRFVFSDGGLGKVFKIVSRFSFWSGAAYNSFADRFLVSWTEGNFGIRGRWYRPSGSPASRRFGIGGSGAQQPIWSTDNIVACSDRGRQCLVVWEKQVQQPNVISDDIYGELLRAP